MPKENTTAPRELTLVMGAAAAPISQQLRLLGFRADRNKIRALQRQADALCLLRIQGLLIDSVVLKARKTLIKRIASVIK